ncbi:MAG: DUF3410 domain-containing protein [Melioribacteraceae bacterium]|nr:DUF3410 domain-containing protein [Melioribacteraceae bacterium]
MNLCKFTDKNPHWKPQLPEADNSLISIQQKLTEADLLFEITNKIYPIEKDSDSLKKLSSMDSQKRGENFDLLRKTYQLRREFNNYTIAPENLSEKQINLLKDLRFNIA